MKTQVSKPKTPKYDYLIVFGSGIVMISFSNLLYKIYTTRDTTSLSWVWIYGNLIAQISYLIYGHANKSVGIFYTSIFFIIGLLYILYSKFMYNKYKTEEKKVGIENIKNKKVFL